MEIKKSKFFPQAKLILQVLPYVFEEEVFALKGGSAINFFFRDMPRLSVDIDLTYLPIESRDVSLEKIEAALGRIAQKIKSNLSDINIQEGRINNPNMMNKIFVKNSQVQIKVEPNLIIRGTIFPVEKRALSLKAQEVFELFVEARTVSFADVFGGKICAALDRQHPRDLYDIKYLLDTERITEQVRKGLLVYLISHNRPIYELVNPFMKEFKGIHKSEFQGMTDENVSYEELIETRSILVDYIKEILTENERKFLVSFERGKPRWDLLEIDGVKQLPAVSWKLINIQKMDGTKRKELVGKLKEFLKAKA